MLKSLNRKWKEYKAKLKTDFKREGMTEEEVARVTPPDVYPQQWRELVHYWFSEKGQVTYIVSISYIIFIINIDCKYIH